MQKWVSWVRARPLWLWAAVGVLGALPLLYLLPLVLVPEAGFDERRLKAENDLRTTFVQAVGAAVLLFGTWQTLYLNREGQITERFTRAIDQLGQTGKEKLDVRLGGIYALERIARESSRDRGAIVEVLTAFLREHARWNPDDADSTAVTGGGEAGSGHEQQTRLRADLQAVATVLERNQWSQQHHFDLSEVDLRGGNLLGAHLEGVNLSGAHLEGANLVGAHLQGAILIGAHLERANLGGAHLERGFLRNARLEGANLSSARLEKGFLLDAHLEGANLSNARLERGFLVEAHLEGANLSDAHLEGAILGDAHLEGANLTNAHLDGTVLIGACLEGVEGLTPAQVEGVTGLNEAIGVPPGLLGT